MSTDYSWQVRCANSLWSDELRWYIDAPGQAGYYGATLQPEMYFSSREEAERAIPMLKQAYLAGQLDAKLEMRKALGL